MNIIYPILIFSISKTVSSGFEKPVSSVQIPLMKFNRRESVVRALIDRQCFGFACFRHKNVIFMRFLRQFRDVFRLASGVCVMN